MESFFSDSDQLKFHSSQTDDRQHVRVRVEVRGLILDAEIDFVKEVAKFGSTLSKERVANSIISEDRNLVFSTLRRVEERRREKNLELIPVWEALEKSLAVWSEWPDHLSLSRDITKKNKSLCEDAMCRTVSGNSYFGPCVDSSGNNTCRFYTYAQHDCYIGDFNKEENQQQACLGAHSTCQGDEWYWDGSKWECGEPNHWTRPYVQGNCFGRCGPGCGMIGTYTSDCANHDGCVRNGHGIAALDCNDQFVSCIDDTLFSKKCYIKLPG